MKSYVAVIAMINGMIGGLILVLPILALQGGTLLSFLIIVTTGFFSFYSCYLCVIHLGEHQDLDQALVYHFGGSKLIKYFYDLLVCINLVFLLLLYYNLIIQQWQGLVPYNLANPICNAVALLVLVFLLSYFHLGAQILGYGIISIMGYCIFLIWMLITAPSGDNTIPLVGKGAVNLAASMGQAFAIQTFFIPVLRQLSSTKGYVKYTFIAYAVGASTYLYIAYTGSFGILNRKQVVFPLQTIQNYFPQGQWQVAIVQALYLLHLYSAFGQFLLVSKKRGFGLFNLKQSKPKTIMNIPQIIYTVLVIGICVGVFFAQISIDNLIEINGAIIGFFFIYFLPALMHAKCLYFPRKVKTNQEPMLENNDQPYNNNKTSNYSHQNNKINSYKNTQQIQLSSVNNRNISNINQLQRHLSSISNTNSDNNNGNDLTTDKKNPITNINNNNKDITAINQQQLQQSNNNNKQQQQQNKGSQKQKADDNNDKDVSEIGQKQPIDLTCKCKKPKIVLQIIDVISLIGMVGLGFFIMVDGFITVVTGQAN